MEELHSWNKCINKLELGIFPTPLYRMTNAEGFLNYKPIYIKRDDITGLGPGGNKTRSLEYILGDAVRQDSNVIIASGPLQSNLCTLAACACSKLKLNCILVHSGEKPDKLEGNLLLNKILDVDAHYIGEVTENQRTKYVDDLFIKLKEEGKRPYIIMNGGSTGYGALGYVNAIYEIFKQCKELGFRINEIFAPGGNGGVAAGLIYGNAILGFPFKINIISVEYDKDTLSNHIRNIIKEVEEITQIPFNYKLEESCSIIDDYSGKGWGRNTIESEQLVLDFPKMEGIFIENVYNSKALVGMFDMIRKSRVSGGVCFIHTGGFGSLFSQY